MTKLKYLNQFVIAITILTLYFSPSNVLAETSTPCTQDMVDQFYAQYIGFRKASAEGDLIALEKIRTSGFFSSWKTKLEKLDRWKDASSIVADGAAWQNDFEKLTFMRCDQSGNIARLVHYSEVEHPSHSYEKGELEEQVSTAMQYIFNMFEKENGIWKVGYAMDSQIPKEEFSAEIIPEGIFGGRVEFDLK